jgi:hypothetical protein
MKQETGGRGPLLVLPVVVCVLILHSCAVACATVPGRTSQQGFCSIHPTLENVMLRPTFTLFGDSLTQRSFDEGGWGGRVASEFQRKVRFPEKRVA